LERFEERRRDFERARARIAAISVDPVEESQKLAHDHELQFPLLSDETGDVIRAYGVWHAEKKISLPAVFIVDSTGTIRWRYVSDGVFDRPDEVKVLEEAWKVRGSER
jgi:peroxiredoxin Q/BCP